MSALGLIDLLPHVAELTPAAAERWVAAALAQAAALHEHDGSLYPADPARRELAEHLHAAWRRWAEDAEVLLRRVDALTGARPIANRERLRDEVGRTLALIQLSPAVIAQRRAKALAGDVHSIEEVRRELRLSPRG